MKSSNEEPKEQKVDDVSKKKENPPKSQDLKATGDSEQAPTDPAQVEESDEKALKKPEVVPVAATEKSTPDEVPIAVAAAPAPSLKSTSLNSNPNLRPIPRPPTPFTSAPNLTIAAQKPTPTLNQILRHFNPPSTSISQQHITTGTQLVLHPAPNRNPVRLIRFIPQQMRQQYMKQPDIEQTLFFKKIQSKHDQLIRRCHLPVRLAIQNTPATNPRAISGVTQEAEEDSDEINKIIKKRIQKAVDEKNLEIEKKNKELENWAAHYKTCFDLNSMLYFNNSILSLEIRKLRNELARRAENERKLTLEIERKDKEVEELTEKFRKRTNELVDENLLVRFECQTEINEIDIKTTLQTVELERAKEKNLENKAELVSLSESMKELERENERAKDEYIKSIHKMAKKLNAEVEEKMNQMKTQKDKEIAELKAAKDLEIAILKKTLVAADEETRKADERVSDLFSSLQEETEARRADQLSWDEMWSGVVKESEEKHALEIRTHGSKVAELEAKILKQDEQMSAYKERDAALADRHRKNLLRTKRMYESEKKILEEYEKNEKTTKPEGSVDQIDGDVEDVPTKKDDVGKKGPLVSGGGEKAGSSRQLKVEEKKDKPIKLKEIVPEKKSEKTISKQPAKPGTSGTQKRHITSSVDHKEKKRKNVE